MELTEQKRELRRQMRAIRKEITADAAVRAQRSALIWERVCAQLDDQQEPSVSVSDGAALNVMLFESLPSEPDTVAWRADADRRGWRTFVPQVDGPRLRVMPGDLDPTELDVVIVPGLAFTADGHRLGQGGGHYDRFLQRLRPSCRTIGVCFHEQLVPSLPNELHDMRVDVIVSA